MMEARRVSEGAVKWIAHSRFSLANAAGFHFVSKRKKPARRSRPGAGFDLIPLLFGANPCWVSQQWHPLLSSRLSRIPCSCHCEDKFTGIWPRRQGVGRRFFAADGGPTGGFCIAALCSIIVLARQNARLNSRYALKSTAMSRATSNEGPVKSLSQVTGCACIASV
jgi:hypothetical protein